VNDDQPYRMKAGERQIVYVPYSYEVNDSNQINYRLGTIDDFERTITRSFDVLYREGAQSARVMAICLHPFMIGVPHRIGGLDAALRYICGHEGVWLATGAEIARAYLESDASI
jgi:hypothetical protein